MYNVSPQGPLTSSSLTEFNDIVVGHENSNDCKNGQTVLRIYGSVICSQNISTKCLKIDSEPTSGQRIFSGYDSIGLTVISDNYQTLNIDTNVIIDTGYINIFGEILIVEPGVYDVFYHLQFQTFNNSAGKYGSISGRLELNTGSGFNTIVGSGSTCFIIEQNGNLINPGTGKEVIVNITIPNSILKVTFARIAGTTTCRIKPEESSLIIKRLRHN